MAVSYDTSVSGEGTAVSSKTVSITVASNRDRYLIVTIEGSGTTDTITSVVFNGSESLTLVSSATSATNQLWVYAVKNPTATTANVVVTFGTTPARCMVIASSFYGVNQTTANGTARTATGTATKFWIGCDEGTPGDMAFGAGAWENVVTAASTLTSTNGIPNWIASGALLITAGVNSRTPAAPAGQQLGDLEIAVVTSENNETHSCSSSGWTSLGTQTNSGATFTVSYWRRVYNGTNVDPVITWTTAVDGSARRHLFRDTKASGTVAATIGTVGTGTAATHTSTGGNTTEDDVLAIYFDHCNANTAMAAETSWTERVDSGSATGPIRSYLADRGMATSGSATGNVSEAGGAAAWVNQQFEVYNAANGDQVSRSNIAHTANNEVMEVATEMADTYNSFGWTCSAAASGTTAIAFVIKAAKSPPPFSRTPRFIRRAA